MPTLSWPEPASAAEEGVIQARFLEIHTRVWAQMGLLLALAALAWWPLDLILFADDPLALQTFAVFRLGIILANPIFAYAGPRLRFLHPYALPVLGLVVMLEVAWAAGSMAVASQGDPAWFGFFYLAPVFTILLMAPLPVRLLINAGVSVAAWATFHLASLFLVPGHSLPALAGLSASQLAFTTVVTVALGHWLYQSIRSQLILGVRLDREHHALTAMTAELEARVAHQTADLQAVYRRASQARSDERRRVGRDLHDELGQELTALALMVENLGPGEEAVAPLRAVIGRARQSLSRVLDDLRPRSLEAQGIDDALRETLRERCEAAGLTWSIEIGAFEAALSDAHAIAVYRIVQEGLNNVLRHADARSVHLALFQEGDRLILSLSDDGTGFAETDTGGQGQSIIRERCASLGGEAHWSQPEGEGTTLRASLALGARA